MTVSAPSVHVGDLDAVSTGQQNTWRAIVTLTVHDDAHAPIASALVYGSWSDGSASSCTSNGSGQCSLSAAAVPKRLASLTFTVVGVTYATSIYASGQNHDADGDSNGTSVRVVKP